MLKPPVDGLIATVTAAITLFIATAANDEYQRQDIADTRAVSAAATEQQKEPKAVAGTTGVEASATAAVVSSGTIETVHICTSFFGFLLHCYAISAKSVF